MTARERAEIIVGMVKQMKDRAAFVFTYDDWIIAATKHIEEAEETARKAAIEEDRKSHPHRFVGSIDRYCEWCNESDRHENHLVPQERINNAVKHEREACAVIAHEELEIEREFAQSRSGEDVAEYIEARIRARSES